MVSDLMLGELTRIGSEPVPTAELDVRATALIGGFSGSLESVDGLVGQVASLAAYDLPLTELSDYPTKVRAVSPEQLQQAFGKRLPTSAFSLIIVGDAAKFLPALKAKHPTVEVIPVDELDLDSATLRCAERQRLTYYRTRPAPEKSRGTRNSARLSDSGNLHFCIAPRMHSMSSSGASPSITTALVSPEGSTLICAARETARSSALSEARSAAS
jgi:hypothetical protein